MKFYEPNKVSVYTNNPQGFQMPYQRYGALDRELKEWSYYRLKNTPSRPTKVRCNSILFGGLDRQTIGGQELNG